METAVEIAADVAEAVIIDKRNKRKKKIENSLETDASGEETEQPATGGN